MEDYQPLCQLLSKLASPALVMPAKQSVSSSPAAGLQPTSKNSVDIPAAAVDEKAILKASEDVTPEVQEFADPSLSEQALRLLQTLVGGHNQVGMHCPSLIQHQGC